MDYHNRLGLSASFNGKKLMFFMFIILLGFNFITQTRAILTEDQSEIEPSAEVVSIDGAKTDLVKRNPDSEADRREHIVNPDGSINYQGSGSGHDSGDLTPPSDEASFSSKLSPGPGARYGPPSFPHGGPSFGFGSSRPSSAYGPPSKVSFRPPKNSYLPPAPKPHFGPPSIPPFTPIPPRPVYGPPKGFGPPAPPKGSYGPPRPISKPGFSSRPRPVYGPPNFSSGTPLTIVGPIKPLKIGPTFGTPLRPSSSYGPPDHFKGSPSPPDIKFDGWKPIPGPPSNSPSGSYGPPGPTGGGGGGFFGGIGSGSFHSSSHSSSHSFGTSSFSSSGPGVDFKVPPKPSSSYGTPLAPSISYGPPGGYRGPSSSKGPGFFSSGFGSIFSKGPGSFLSPLKSHGFFSKPLGSLFNSLRRPSSSYGPPKRPSSSYGPPHHSFDSFSSGPSYRLPRPPTSSYGPPKPPSSSYGPPKPPSSSYGPPTGSGGFFGSLKPPSSSYGPPTGPSASFVPPKPPSSSYGAPIISTNYKIPKPGFSISTPPSTAYRGPPVPHPLQPPAIGTSSLSGGLYNKPLSPTALYGVPDVSLTPVTGVGCCGPSTVGLTVPQLTNSYGVPLTNIQAPFLPPTGFAPTSPAAAPYQAYGVPLPTGDSGSHHSHHHGGSTIPPTVLPLPQPKKPVKFRPPVPDGLISSIGAKWSSSGAWGGQSYNHHHHHQHQGPTYIPPAVPDPDPGVRANKGNPTIIPPPTAPPVQYGPPPPGAPHREVHHQASNQLDTSISANDIEGGLNPPPLSASLHNDYQIQPSIPLELPIDHHQSATGSGQSYEPSGAGSTSYNSNVNTGNYHQSESYAASSSGNENFNPGVQTIPIKGTQGSYTLQIQAAGGNTDQQIPHGEVLSNGLLQDILAAIENPAETVKLSQYSGSQVTDPVANEIGMSVLKQLGETLTQDSSSIIQQSTQYGKDLASASSNNFPEISQSEPQNGDSSTYYATGTGDTSYQNNNQSRGGVYEYLNKNNIAFYYNNQADGQDSREGSEKDYVQVQTLPSDKAMSRQLDSRESDTGSLSSADPQNAHGNAKSNNSTMSATNILENSRRSQLDNRDSRS